VQDPHLGGVLAALRDRRGHRRLHRRPVVGVDVLEHVTRRLGVRYVLAGEQRRAAFVPAHPTGDEVDLPDPDHAGLEGDLHAGERGAEVGRRRGQLELRVHGRGHLTGQLDVLGGPGTRDRGQHRQRTDGVAGQHQRQGQDGADLPGGDGRHPGHPRVRSGVRHHQGGAQPGGRRPGRVVQRAGRAGHRRPPGAAHRDRDVGEEHHLRRLRPQQPGGQPGQPVERSAAGELGDQPAGEDQPRRVLEGIGACGRVGHGYGPPPREATAGPGTATDRPCCHAPARPGGKATTPTG
jgi:hypothetical protein